MVGKKIPTKLWRISRAGSDPARDEIVEKLDKPHLGVNGSRVRLTFDYAMRDYGLVMDFGVDLAQCGEKSAKERRFVEGKFGGVRKKR